VPKHRLIDVGNGGSQVGPAGVGDDPTRVLEVYRGRLKVEKLTRRLMNGARRAEPSVALTSARMNKVRPVVRARNEIWAVSSRVRVVLVPRKGA